MVAKAGAGQSPSRAKRMLHDLATLSESRGKDSSGLALRNEQERVIHVFRGPVSVKHLLAEPEVN